MIGSVVAGHRIVRLLGRGGMGVVYEATDEALGRSVALKLVAPERADQPGFRERFIAESRLAASIDHPNVLPVFKAGEDEGLLYLAMRLVDGADLRTLAPLEPARAAHVVAQVGAALDAAHARRLVHRDVKPANVLVGGADHAYLTDFGLVKALDATSGHTRTGDVVGTLDYIAPERIRGESDGPPGDVYGLGCVLFYALTGEVPFPLDAAERKLWAHLSAPPPPVPGHPAFDAVVARALAKDPAQRYGSGAELGAAALAAAGGSQPSVPLEAARRSERGIRAAAGPAVAAQAAAPAGRARARRRACAAAARGAGRDAAGAHRAAPGRGPRRPRSRQGPARRRARAAARRAAADAGRARRPSTPRRSGSCVELETVRGRVLADDATAGERLAALQHELETLADGMAAAGGERTP